MTEVKIVVVKTNEYDDLNFEGPDFNSPDFKEPSKWYIVNALGFRVYFCCRSREDAQNACDQEYGKNKYRIKTTSTSKPKGDISARGTNSAKGFVYMKKR